MESPHPLGKADAPLLEAVKRDPADHPDGEVSYCVLDEAKGEARRQPRRRTRLRTGKIIDLANSFLVECQIHDRSATGARVRLMAPLALPALLRLFEDEAGDAVDARLVWSKGREAGLRFSNHPQARPLSASDRATLAGKYYAANGRRGVTAPGR
jgi:hypothetical protein